MCHNFIKVAAVAATYLSISSCQAGFGEMSPVEKTTPETNLTISATYEGVCDTRTSIDNSGKVYWSKEDAFALISSEGKGKFNLTEGDGQASAVFAGTAVGNAPYYALYPYSEECRIENGILKFQLPQEQNTQIGTFGIGASPAVAVLASQDAPAQFKNLCGVLEIGIIGGGIKISRIAVQSLSGEALWGDCSLALDGKQGTNEQTMQITGGSNTVYVNLDKTYTLLASTPRIVDIVLPAGSLSKGFTVKAFAENGKCLSFISTQKPEGKIVRSTIINAGKLKVTSDNAEPLDPLGRGFLKEIFMDSGMHLADLTYLAIGPYLDWEYDYMLCSGETEKDSLYQQKILVGDDDDLNGVLLYPDGEPRYRMVYMNGGTATNHGRTLAEEGRDRYITFVNNGGSYFGTCAGAYIASAGVSASALTNKKKEYLGIYPSYVYGTGLYDSTGMVIPKDSPLLDYYDFGGDHYIDSVKHAGGCYAPDGTLPAKAECLLIFDYYADNSHKIHNKVSAWAYKANNKKGRVVACGSHPERTAYGERRDLMAAFCRYAVDGNAAPDTKSNLINGKQVVMDKPSTSNIPRNSRIGDKQYHHFKITVPDAGVRNFKLAVDADDSYDLTISLRKDDFAWRTDADYVLATKGGKKELAVDSLSAGTWYASVYCATCLKIKCSDKNMKYTGDISVLNGVPYKITASWE